MNLGGHFDIKEKKEKISKLESDLNDPDIWNNHELASNINSKLSSLKKNVENFFTGLTGKQPRAKVHKYKTYTECR